jgi:hypothetical protein
MQPWLAYGQTLMRANSPMDNPKVNINGLIGESIIPYKVPEGFNLILTGWGFEGLNEGYGVCIPWIGELPCTNSKCLSSIGPWRASYYVNGMEWIIPSGLILNIRLLNGSSEDNVVCAWYVQGKLVAREK